MNWKDIESESDLAELNERSRQVPQLIFKHSTRCGTSSMALDRMQRAVQPENLEIHYLDLLLHRNLSNKIAADYKVQHESPQILLIKNGACEYDASHGEINMKSLTAKL